MTYKIKNNTDHISEDIYCKPLIIIGAGGHAISLANVALSAGFSIKNFIDKNNKNKYLLGSEVIGTLDELGALDNYCFGVGIGDNAIRERIVLELKDEYGKLIFPPLVHSSAIISPFVNIGEGVVIMPNVVIGPNARVDRFCIINTKASIDHECVLNEFASLAPGALLGGGVQVGTRSAISIGAIIRHGLSIGDDSLVGACSYLNKDLPANKVAYGIPAKQVRSRNKGDLYLS